MGDGTLTPEELSALLGDDFETDDSSGQEAVIADSDLDVLENVPVQTDEPVVQQSPSPAASAPKSAASSPSASQQKVNLLKGNLPLLLDIFMQVTVELGRTRMLVKDVLGLGEGSIIELDKLANDPVELMVGNKVIARGEIVVIDENFGVRITEVSSPREAFKNLLS